MQRLFLVLVVLALVIAAFAVTVRAISRAVTRDTTRNTGPSGEAEAGMIQNGAYVALLFLILGVALGWLGGL